jgi:hypothetical protein
VAVVVAACAGSERSPLEVTELLDESVVTADWAGIAEFYAPDATWQINDSPVIRLADELPPDAGVVDWDGDGVVTEQDFFFSLGAELYAGGTTSFLSCSQSDDVTAVCQEAREGYAFLNLTHAADWVITLADGLVSSIVIDLTGNGVDQGKVIEFQGWVEDNRPDAPSDLFRGYGIRNVTPENAETHRQLATEWLATK